LAGSAAKAENANADTTVAISVFILSFLWVIAELFLLYI
jgi:hypothetical protein